MTTTATKYLNVDVSMQIQDREGTTQPGKRRRRVRFYVAGRCGLLADSHQVKLFVVKLDIRLHRDLLPIDCFSSLNTARSSSFERARDVGVDPQHEALAVEVGADLLHLRQDLVADRRA